MIQGNKQDATKIVPVCNCKKADNLPINNRRKLDKVVENQIQRKTRNQSFYREVKSNLGLENFLWLLDGSRNTLN